MQKVRVPISSFQFGEVSDSLRMRTDSPVYAQSAKKLENMIVMSEGSVKKRTGLKHIYDYSITYNSTYPAQSHLFKFVFDENEEYVISVEHQKVRCFRLLSDGSVSLVSTITADVDSATLPFDQEYLQEYTYAQYGDVMFISHPLFMPRMLTRTSLTNFEVSTFAFDARADDIVVYQPYSRYHAQGVTLDPSATTGTGITLTVSEDYWDTTGTQSGGNYPDSKHVGVVVRYGKSEIEITSVQSATQATGDVVDELKIRLSVLNPFRTIDGSSTVEVTHLGHGFGGGESITIQNASSVGGINTGNLNGVRTVGDIIDENTYTFTAGGSASSADDGGGYVSIVCHAPTDDWDEQSYSAARGYPAAVTFHENRLCFGGTLAEPDTIWMSQIGSFFNFDEGEAADNEAITLTAATGDVNEIRYMISNRDLQVFTASGELYIPTYLNQAITPTNAQIRKQTPYGSSFVQPVSIDGATVYVQQNGRIVREYLYSDSEEAYTSTAISTVASHLIDDPKCMTVVHSGFGLPDSYAALTLGNGDMALFSSNRAERRASWTNVTTGGRFCSVVAIEDRLFVNVWYNNQLHLCEFSGNIGVDNYITDQVISDEATIPTIQYGDFEGTTIGTFGPTSPSGRWYVNTTSGANWETYDKPSYSRIARIIKTSSDSLLGGQTVFYANDFQFKKGVTYTIEFTLYNAAGAQGFGTTADVRLKIGSGPLYTGDWITDSDYGAGGITTFTESFTPTADGYYDIQFEAAHTSATSWAVGLDDVSIISAVNEPLDLNAINSGFAAGDVVSVFEGETYIDDETLDSDGAMPISKFYGKTVSIGKKFTAKIETNEIDASMGSGPVTGTVRGLANIVVDFKDTRSAKVNSRKFILEDDFSGKKEFRVLGYSRTPTVIIEQDDPLPMQVNGIVAELVT